MFTSEEYLTAWGVYLFGALVFYICWWRFTSSWWLYLKGIFRVLPASMLFTPWYTDRDETHLAPAWFISAADMLTFDASEFWRAGIVWIAVTAALLVLLLLYFVWRWVKQDN